MIYLPESYYLDDTADFDVEKAVRVTAQAVGRRCRYYHAGIIWAFKGRKKWKQAGALPASSSEKEVFVGELVRRLFDDSAAPLFALFLDTEPIDETFRERSCKFDHHDDQCCWNFDLTEQEFAELQKTWKENGLPEDLFYLESKSIQILQKPGPVGRFLNALGFTGGNYDIYTPKRWERKNALNED